MTTPRLTRRGHLAVTWATGLLLIFSPGLAEMLGTWLVGPTP